MIGRGPTTNFLGVLPGEPYIVSMPNYRRYFVAGGTYFFTLKTDRNIPIFREPPPVALLGNVFREMKKRWPVKFDAIVLLPDHLHAIWSLPPGDADYAIRWAWVKKEFTKRYLATGGKERSISDSRRKNRRRGVWQRRYWEHTIQDEDDFDAHFDYVHWNPVKHRYAQRVIDWPYSSFHRWVNARVYPANWGCGGTIPSKVALVNEAGE